jgi:hypothetical protein
MEASRPIRAAAVRIMRAAVTGMLLPLTSGCTNLVSLDWSREVGWITTGHEPTAVLEFPDSVRRSVPTFAIVTTRGSSSCTRPAGAEVAGDQLEVRITPYDMIAPPGTGCTRDLAVFPRQVEVRFMVAGDATIRVRGRVSPGSSETVEVVRKVVVLP